MENRKQDLKKQSIKLCRLLDNDKLFSFYMQFLQKENKSENFMDDLNKNIKDELCLNIIKKISTKKFSFTVRLTDKIIGKVFFKNCNLTCKVMEG